MSTRGVTDSCGARRGAQLPAAHRTGRCARVTGAPRAREGDRTLTRRGRAPEAATTSAWMRRVQLVRGEGRGVSD